MFADDGAFEMPYFESLGVPSRYQGHEQIRGFFTFLRELFPDLQLGNTKLSVKRRTERWSLPSTSSPAVQPKLED
jgi:hypothetical protein